MPLFEVIVNITSNIPKTLAGRDITDEVPTKNCFSSRVLGILSTKHRNPNCKVKTI